MKILMSVPGVVGESTTAGHLNRIVLASCDIGFGRPNDPVTGVPIGSLRYRHLSIRKIIDTSTAFFGNAAGLNLLLPESSFVVFRSDFRGTELDTCQMTLSRGRVESFEFGFNSGGSIPEESILISFEKLVVKTYQRSSTGTLLGTSSFTFSQA